METADHQRMVSLGLSWRVVTGELIHTVSIPWRTSVLILPSQGDERGVGGGELKGEAAAIGALAGQKTCPRLFAMVWGVRCGGQLE
jgi:hypothetical protein